MNTASIPEYVDDAVDNWLICTACGTQYPTADRNSLKTCRICDDPRQYTPPSGQSFTTMQALEEACHRNVFHPHTLSHSTTEVDAKGIYPTGPLLLSIVTEPKFAIGQRAILVRTIAGNILWDCLTFLDIDTIGRIRALGGLKAIVISHPHYYSAHAHWANVFKCPVYLACEDKEWLTMTSASQVFLGTDAGEGGGSDDAATATHDILISGQKSGFQAIRLGGHFPGSLVGLCYRRLFVADTLITTPAGVGNWEFDAMGSPRSRPPGMNSFAFMWSIPNMIPLSADEVAQMWERLKGHEFRSTHGAFIGHDIENPDVKHRILSSMQIQVSRMGWTGHALLGESL